MATTDATATAGVLLALTAAVLWSTSGLFINLLELPALPVAGWRSVIAGLALSPFIRREHLRPRPGMLLLIVANAVVMATFVVGVRYSTTANAIALQSTAPAWVFLLTCLLARAWPWRLFAPVAVVLVGIAVILAEPATGTNVFGNMVGVWSGVGFGLYSVLVSRLRLPAFGLVGLANLGGGLLVLALAPGWFDVTAIAPGQWAILLYLGVVQIGLAHSLFALALRRIPTTQAQILVLLEPLLNPLWVFLVIGEVPTAFGLTGGAMILLGIATDVAVRRRTRAAPQQPLPPARG